MAKCMRAGSAHARSEIAKKTKHFGASKSTATLSHASSTKVQITKDKMGVAVPELKQYVPNTPSAPHTHLMIWREIVFQRMPRHLILLFLGL
jgi:hypothetical protein